MSRSTIRTLVVLNALSLVLVAGLAAVVIVLLRRPPPPPVFVPVETPAVASAAGETGGIPYRDRWAYVDAKTGERREGVIDDDMPLLERFIAEAKLEPGLAAALRDRLAARRKDDARMAALMVREGRWNNADFILAKRWFWSDLERLVPPDAVAKMPPDYRSSGAAATTTTTTTTTTTAP